MPAPFVIIGNTGNRRVELFQEALAAQVEQERPAVLVVSDVQPAEVDLGCEYCLAGKEQHCIGKSTNHLHHEDGSFQEYISLDADYLTLLPEGVDPSAIGPVLCAGLTAYKVCEGGGEGNGRVPFRGGDGLGSNRTDKWGWTDVLMLDL